MDNKESSLTEEIDKLEKALKEESDKRPRGTSIQVHDRSDLAAKYLVPKAIAALSKKGRNLIEQYNEDLGNDNYVRKAAICEFFTCQVLKGDEEEGVKALSETINKLAEMGAIQACLSPMSSIDLALQMFQQPTAAVFCYVHIKPEFREVSKTMKYYTLEGGVGPALHDFSIDLPKGEFLASCWLSHQMAMLIPPKSNEARIFDVANDYLKYLPEGTEFIGYRSVAIIDLSAPYELRFRNKLLQNVKRVELNYVRQAALITEGGKEVLKQFNLVTGISYFGDNTVTGEKNVDLFNYRVQKA